MMNKLFKPVSLLMYLLVVLVFFMAGMTLAGVSGVAKGQGLAGGAIVFFYGVFTAIIAFIISLFVAYKTTIKRIIKINKIFVVLLLVAVCLFVYRVISINKSETPENELPAKTTSPANKKIGRLSYKDLKNPVLLEQNSEPSMGIGFFKPILNIQSSISIVV